MPWNAEELRERFKIPFFTELMRSGEYDAFVEEYRGLHPLMITPEMHLKAGSGLQGLVDGEELNEGNVSKPIIYFLANDHEEVCNLLRSWVKPGGPLTPETLASSQSKRDLSVIRFLKEHGRLTKEQLTALKKKGVEL